MNGNRRISAVAVAVNQLCFILIVYMIIANVKECIPTADWINTATVPVSSGSRHGISIIYDCLVSYVIIIWCPDVDAGAS